jgi:cob(I)alamin adenosyltransferase
VPAITEESITELERGMDAMEKDLAPMRSFILPGGHPSSSQAHICRTVCRRAERRVVQLSGITEVDPILVRYLNRLSDYFFMLARHLAHLHGVADTPWDPKG